MRHPGVQRHIGQHARAVQKPGLGRHKEERRLRDQGRDDERCPRKTTTPIFQVPKSFSKRTAFMVLPSTGIAPTSA